MATKAKKTQPKRTSSKNKKTEVKNCKTSTGLALLRRPNQSRKKVPRAKMALKRILTLVKVLPQTALKSPRKNKPRTNRDEELPVIDADATTQGVQVSTDPSEHVNGFEFHWNYVNQPMEVKQLAPPQPTPEPLKKQPKYSERAQKVLGIDEEGRPTSPNSPGVVYTRKFGSSNTKHHSIAVAALRALRVKFREIIHKFSNTDTAR